MTSRQFAMPISCIKSSQTGSGEQSRASRVRHRSIVRIRGGHAHRGANSKRILQGTPKRSRFIGGRVNYLPNFASIGTFRSLHLPAPMLLLNSTHFQYLQQLGESVFRSKATQVISTRVFLSRFCHGVGSCWRAAFVLLARRLDPIFHLNYAHNERPGRGPAQVMQFGFD